MKYLFISLITIILFSFNSCDKNTKAEVPAFLYVDSIEIKINKASEGAPTHNITELWVYSDGKAVGVFNKGELIPIIIDDYKNPKIEIFAGIRANGSRSEIETYYLLNEILINKPLIPGEIDTISAVFQYEPDTKFVFVEDFENGNIFLKDLDGDKNTNIVNSSIDPATGKLCGRIELTEDKSVIAVTSSQEYFDLPKNTGNKVYLEIDYKNNTEFYIGIIGKEFDGTSHKVDIIFLKQKEDWNKLYLNLTNTIQNSALNSYQIYFRANHNDENTTSVIQLDNIKLLYLGR